MGSYAELYPPHRHRLMLLGFVSGGRGIRLGYSAGKSG